MRKLGEMQTHLLLWTFSSKGEQAIRHISQMRGTEDNFYLHQNTTQGTLTTRGFQANTALNWFASKEMWKSNLKLLVQQMQMQISTPTDNFQHRNSRK